MAGDDDFEPRLGRIRSGGSKRGAGYLRRVFKAVALAGARSSTSRFQGNRIGRGAGAGRVLLQRDRYAAFRTRRVVIKTRVVKFKGQGLKAAQLHLRYIQRDGVTREGQPGALYDREGDHADGRAFLERSGEDRHQFRLIIAPEDGAEYDDLKPFVRKLMARMEDDLGTKLDWVAVDHHNTGHPHTHIVLRGRDDLDRDLVIAREYISHGMRERAAEILSLDLGPKTDAEINDQLRKQMDQERFTDLDKALKRQAGESGELTFDKPAAGIAQHYQAGRLQKLAKLDLADEIAPGRWRLANDLEPVLRRMGERGDIIKAMHRELTAAGIDRGTANYVIFDPARAGEQPLVGRLVVRGIADEEKDTHFLVLDGVDGRAHYVDIGTMAGGEEPAPGSVLAVRGHTVEPRQSDRTIAAVAARHGGRYSVEAHQRFDPSASREFVEAHVRRLEAMRREGRNAERSADGSWTVPQDFAQRGVAFDQARGKTKPVLLETLSALPIAKLERMAAATWLDRELVAKRTAPLREQGFGSEVRAALERRRQWLIAEGLAREEGGKTLYRGSLLSELKTRELNQRGRELEGSLKKPYAAQSSGKIEGVYRGPVELASGRFAIIEKARDFTLVPWRPVLERLVGRPVSGIARGEAITWSVGKQRGPSIT